jgi:hypothetical protein
MAATCEASAPVEFALLLASANLVGDLGTHRQKIMDTLLDLGCSGRG